MALQWERRKRQIKKLGKTLTNGKSVFGRVKKKRRKSVRPLKQRKKGKNIVQQSVVRPESWEKFQEIHRSYQVYTSIHIASTYTCAKYPPCMFNKTRFSSFLIDPYRCTVSSAADRTSHKRRKKRGRAELVKSVPLLSLSLYDSSWAPAAGPLLSPIRCRTYCTSSVIHFFRTLIR